MVSLSELNPIFQELLRAMFPGIVLEGIDDQVAPNINNNDGEDEEEEEEEVGPTNIEPATVGIATTSSSSSLDRTATTLNFTLKSSSTATSLSSVSSSQSGLGDQSDKGEPVGHANTQSNLNGGNGELESQGEEESNLGYEAEDEEEEDQEEDQEGNDPNPADQEEAPSLNESASQGEPPAQVGGNNNGGDQDGADGNLSDVSVSLGDLVSRHSDEGDSWEDTKELYDKLNDPYHMKFLSRRTTEKLNGLLDELVFLSESGPLTKAMTIGILLEHFPECSGQSGLEIDQEVFKWVTADQLGAIKIKLGNFADLYLARHPAPAPEAIVPVSAAASPAVRALESTSTPVLNGIIDFLVRFINGKGQVQANSANSTPTGGDDGVAPPALESKAEAFLKKCDDKYYGALIVWLGDAIKRAQLYGQAYDCNVRFSSLKARFLQVLPQVERTLPLIPGFEGFNGALSDRLLIVLIDRSLAANFHVVIKNLHRYFIKPVVGTSQSLPNEMAFSEKSFFDDDVALEIGLALGAPEEITPLPGLVESVMVSKFSFINVAGLIINLDKRNSQKASNSLTSRTSRLVCSKVFEISIRREVGLESAIKSLEKAIGVKMFKLMVKHAEKCAEFNKDSPYEISDFIFRNVQKAVENADIFPQSSLDPQQVESDFIRRHYVSTSNVLFSRLSEPIRRTLEWGSFLIRESWTQLDGLEDLESGLKDASKLNALRRLFAKHHVALGHFQPYSPFHRLLKTEILGERVATNI